LNKLSNVRMGDTLWMIRKGVSVPIKLVCPACRGTGFLESVVVACFNCDGAEFVTKDVPTYEVVGSVRVSAVGFPLGQDEPVIEVLRPPLYLLSAYKGDIRTLCEDYWEDFDKGKSHAGAYRVVVRDLNMLAATFDEAIDQANEITNFNIQDACDKEKTMLYDRPEDIFRQTAVTQAKADTVEIFKETEIEPALC